MTQNSIFIDCSSYAPTLKDTEWLHPAIYQWYKKVEKWGAGGYETLTIKLIGSVSKVICTSFRCFERVASFQSSHY